MDKLRLILMAVFLFVAVCFDIKRKTIPVLWIALNAPVMLVYGYIETGYSFLWGVLVGVIILVFSLISREALEGGTQQLSAYVADISALARYVYH